MKNHTLNKAIRLSLASLALLAVTQGSFAQPVEKSGTAPEPAATTTIILNQALSEPKPTTEQPVILSGDAGSAQEDRRPAERPRGHSRSEQVRSAPDKPLLEVKGF